MYPHCNRRAGADKNDRLCLQYPLGKVWAITCDERYVGADAMGRKKHSELIPERGFRRIHHRASWEIV